MEWIEFAGGLSLHYEHVAHVARPPGARTASPFALAAHVGAGHSFFTGHCEEVSGTDCNATIFISESFFDVVNVLHMFVLSSIKSGVSRPCRSERFTVMICSSSRFFAISECKFAGITVDLVYTKSLVSKIFLTANNCNVIGLSSTLHLVINRFQKESN